MGYKTIDVRRQSSSLVNPAPTCPVGKHEISGSKAVRLEPAIVIDTADRQGYLISISESTKSQARIRMKEPTLNDGPLVEKSFNHIGYPWKGSYDEAKDTMFGLLRHIINVNPLWLYI